MSTELPPERYLDLLQRDGTRLLDVARRGLDAQVPSCPGWSVGDLVQHVGAVYLHKVECMRQNAAPEPWPPPELEAREPLSLLAEALRTLLSELRERGTDSPSATWWPPDQTSGFWYRRMAQETAVHRVDAELAYDDLTPVDPELAADGVDEILAVMLRAEWASGPDIENAVDGRIRVGTGGRTWTLTVTRDDVQVELSDGDAAGGDPADVQISGEPAEVLLWLWGRLGDDAVTFRGDRAVAAALRRRLAETD
jgi:uncharacterized protein (TIGR03083 family)